jgi:hypothetical protein
MKLNELIQSFEIQMSNEERDLYDSISQPIYISQFNERELFILESLIRKSLISKVRHGINYMVVRND